MCGPSGVGKSTLITRLQADFPGQFGFSVSHTTRQPRCGEVDGVHYYFSTIEDVQKEIQEGKFLESALVHGNLYGTSYDSIRRVTESGKICILDIDVQGVRSCRAANFPVGSYIFISPPNLKTLEQRLRGRNTETEESLARRLGNAESEVKSAKSMWWDAWIVNDDLDQAYIQLVQVLKRSAAAVSLELPDGWRFSQPAKKTPPGVYNGNTTPALNNTGSPLPANLRYISAPKSRKLKLNRVDCTLVVGTFYSIGFVITYCFVLPPHFSLWDI